MKLLSKAMITTGVSAALLLTSAAAAANVAPTADTRVAGTIGVRQAVSGVQRVNSATGPQQGIVAGVGIYIIAALGALALGGGIYAATHHHHHGVSS